MGDKITIDSATMVNKAFEAIEARWLYRLPYSRIDCRDPSPERGALARRVRGRLLQGPARAARHAPPIQYALTYPERLPLAGVPRRTRRRGAASSLSALDEARFPAYRVAREAAAAGGNRGTVLNAADEVAVAAFLEGTHRLRPHRRNPGGCRRPLGQRRRAGPGWNHGPRRGGATGPGSTPSWRRAADWAS